MENKEFNISKPVAAFIALVIAFLVIGYYVVNLLDIETQGTTAEEAILPRMLGEPSETFRVRYPDGWSAEALTSGYVFTLDEADEPKPEIQITLEEGSVESLLPADQQDSAAADNPFTGEADGRRYSITDETGQTRVQTDVVFYPLPDRRTIRGQLSAPANDINDYRDDFNLMISSLDVELLELVDLPPRDSIDPPELPQTIDDSGTTVIANYPENWSAEAFTSGNVFGITISSSATNITMFAVSPSETASGVFLLQPAAEITPESIISTVESQLVRSRILESTTTRTIGEYEGATIIVRNTDSVTENGVLAYSEDIYFSYSMTTSLDNLPAARAALDAIVQSFVYDAPVDLTLEEATALVEEDAEAFELSQSFYSATYNVTVRHPETWQASEVPGQGGQTLLLFVAPDDPSLQLLSLAVPPEGVTANAEDTLLAQIEPSLSPDNIVQATTPVTAGDLEGATLVELGLNRVPGQKMPNITEYGLYDLPDGSQIFFVGSTSADRFAQLQVTLHEIAASVQVGDTTAEDVESDTSDENTDVDTDAVEDDAADDSEAEADDSASEDDAGSEDETTDESSESNEASDDSTDERPSSEEDGE